MKIKQKVADPITPDTALTMLLEGSRRFVSGKHDHPHINQDYREFVADSQTPFAAILTCADSRVPPVTIFDQGLGDLFIVRVAGSVLSESVIGSLEYAVKHLAVQLVLSWPIQIVVL